MTRLSAENCAVILVNYNTSADTLAALTALANLRTLPSCLLVVDNGSRPGEAQKLEHGWRALCAARGLPARCSAPGTRRTAHCPDSLMPEAQPPAALLLRLAQNSGFSGGNNAALRWLLGHTTAGQCAAFWLLNNDTEPDPGGPGRPVRAPQRAPAGRALRLYPALRARAAQGAGRGRLRFFAVERRTAFMAAARLRRIWPACAVKRWKNAWPMW